MRTASGRPRRARGRTGEKLTNLSVEKLSTMLQVVKQILRVSDIYAVTCRSSTSVENFSTRTPAEAASAVLPECPDDRYIPPAMDDSPKGKSAREPRLGSPAPRWGSVATGGAEFTVTILVGLFVGQWVDRRLGTGPWLLILGTFVGAAAGFFRLYRALSTGQRPAQSQDDHPPSDVR